MSEADDGTRAAKARCRRSASRSAVDRRACVSAYLAKKAIGSNDSVAEYVARSGPRRCATPSDSMSDADRVEMARCLRAMAPPTAGAALAMSTLVHQHLWTPPAAPPPQCKPLGTSATTTTVRGASSASAECVKSAGMASWSVSGLASENGSECGRHWQGTAEVRCLFADRDVLFIGNSVMRRQVFTLLDLLAGPAAHRLSVNGGETVNVSTADGTPAMAPSELLSSTRLWDLDGHEHGYHAAQLLTIDLATGAHRFHLPHR